MLRLEVGERPPPPAAVDAEPLRSAVIVLLVAATFGGGMAMIVPMAYSLSVKLDELAPGRADLLGLVLGIGSAVSLIAAPLSGILSDRTRSRWGRRRPFTLAGLVIGLVSAPIMALAPDVAVLILGWCVSCIGWGTAVGSIGNYQADRLPASQRGKVSGITSLTMQISPVIGILLVGLVSGRTLWVFLVPAVVGLVLVLLFVFLVPEEDNRGAAQPDRLSPRRLVASYGFRPRESPDFAWNWLGRFVFFLGLSLTTGFTTFFFAQRLGIAVADLAPFIALTSVLGIGSAMIGSLGGGWLSDRLRRRHRFVVAGAAIFAAGSVVLAFAGDVAVIIAGTLVSSLGIAVFSTVGQAVVLDVLPHRETEAGRYMAITAFSQKIPGVIAPLVAPLLLAVGATGENYTLLYVAAGLLALAGGILIGVRVKGVS